MYLEPSVNVFLEYPYGTKFVAIQIKFKYGSNEVEMLFIRAKLHSTRNYHHQANQNNQRRHNRGFE